MVKNIKNKTMKTISGNDYLESKELVKQLEQEGWTSQDYKTQSYGGSDVFLSCEMTHDEYSEYILTVTHDAVRLLQINEFNEPIPLLLMRNKKVGDCLNEIQKHLN